MRRDMSNHRPWHRGGGEYDYPEGSGYHQRGHARYRAPYEGGGYESDDYDQELRDFNFSRQREREKEQGRHRHDRGGRDRDREDGNYSGNERFYPDNQDRWRDDRSSSGSFEDLRDRKDAHPREFPDEHDRDHFSEEEDQASLHGKPSSRDVEQDERRVKRKEKKKKRKPRSPSPEDEPVEEKKALSAGEDAEYNISVNDKKKKERVPDPEVAAKSKEGDREWEGQRSEKNGTKNEELPAKDSSDKMLASASPPLPNKGIKRKEKKEKRKRHKRICSLGEEEEERELEEEAARLEEAASRGSADMELPVNKQTTSVNTESQRLENKDVHSAPETNRFDHADIDEKPPRRHSADERLSKEERELSREAGSRSPHSKTHRDDRRRDWDNKDGVKPKRRRTSNGESPPPPPPPPPPPREAGEGYPQPVDMPPRVGPPPPDALGTQIIRPPYDVAPAPGHQLYDANRVVPMGTSPATLSPIPPVGIPLNPSVVAPPNIGTPPLAAHSPGVTVGVAPLPGLASPQGVVPPPPPPHPDYNTPPPIPQPSNTDTLLDLLRRYPVVWQGLLALKNDSAAVQMHYLAGNGRLAEVSLPQAPTNGIGNVPPPIRIAQRMRLEPSQLEGVIRRMQVGTGSWHNVHCQSLSNLSLTNSIIMETRSEVLLLSLLTKSYGVAIQIIY